MTNVTDREPVTLQQAHDALRRQRPEVAASAARWRQFHEKAARIYTSVAAVDDAHHYEALAFAAMSREDADKVSNAPTRAEKPE